MFIEMLSYLSSSNEAYAESEPIKPIIRYQDRDTAFFSTKGIGYIERSRIAIAVRAFMLSKHVFATYLPVQGGIS